MKTRIVNVVQGTPEWKSGRKTRRNASDLACAMGIDPNGRYRSDLVKELALGIEREFSEFVQERIINPGHEIEAAARIIIEGRINEDLYPVVLAGETDGIVMGASLDGITMDDRRTAEIKRRNAKLWDSVFNGAIPHEYHPQMEQGLWLSGAEVCLFVVSDGTDEGTISCEYRSDPELRAKIIPTWKQLEEDVKNYQHVEVIPAAVANSIRDFPAVRYEVVGMSLTSNVASEIKPYVLAEVAKFEKKPETDQEFADLDAFTKKARAAVKKSVVLRETVMSGLVDFDQFFRDMQEVEGILTKAAISGENLFKAEKINRKQSLITKSREEYGEYWSALCKRIGGQWIPTKEVTYWSDAIKGLSSMKSIESELGTALANAKIEASAIADKIQENEEAARELMHLFPDFGAMCQKEPADFNNLIIARQAEAERRENARLESERARIRAEEQEKARVANEKDAKLRAELQLLSGQAVVEALETLQPTRYEAGPVPDEQATITTEQKAAAVIEHQDEIAAFMASRDFGKHADTARAILIEFVKFQAERALRKAA